MQMVLLTNAVSYRNSTAMLKGTRQASSTNSARVHSRAGLFDVFWVDPKSGAIRHARVGAESAPRNLEPVTRCVLSDGHGDRDQQDLGLSISTATGVDAKAVARFQGELKFARQDLLPAVTYQSVPPAPAGFATLGAVRRESSSIGKNSD
jgi:hypothetical protein